MSKFRTREVVSNAAVAEMKKRTLQRCEEVVQLPMMMQKAKKKK